MKTISQIETAYDSRNRSYRRLPRAAQTLPVGTLVCRVADGGRTIYRVIEGPAMDQELVLVETGPVAD
jgi:hypothetical protein